jgi:hypothetical protein
MADEPKHKPPADPMSAMMSALASMQAVNERLMARLDAVDGKSEDEVRLEQMRNRLKVPGWDTPKVKFVSERTTCPIEVLMASAKPGAKVLAITDVRMPSGADRNVKFGGIVPDGIQVFSTKDGVPPSMNKDGLDESTVMAMNEGMYTRAYREWRFGALLQPDRLEYVGKPLPDRLLPKTAS